MAAALLLCAIARAGAAEDPPMEWSLAVLSDRADGVALVNGVPIHRVAKAGTPGKNPSTASLPLAPWLVNGVNRIELRLTRIAPGGEFGGRVITEQARDGAFERLVAPGVVGFEVTARGLPRWRFLDAEPLGNDQPNLLKAVQALHEAASRLDAKALIAARKPFFDDLSQIYGAPPPELEAELAEELMGAKVQPLPEYLQITPAHDGKLVVVESIDGLAPVRAEGKAGRMELGQYWARFGGQWLVVR